MPYADPNAPGRSPAERRLNSWKAIGAFFERDERTVRRWETERGMPVHRVPGAGRASVYAYAGELAEWLKTADPESLPDLPGKVPPESAPHVAPAAGGAEAVGVVGAGTLRPTAGRRGIPEGILLYAVAAVGVLAAFLFVYRHYSFSRSIAADALPARVKPAPNPEAQELYLRGVYHWNKRTAKDLQQALDEFTQSIVRDPNYAPAYVGLANCYNLLREFSLMPPSEAYPRAMAAARRAIALDDSLAEAHNSLAFAEFYWSWDASGAEHEFRRAIELSPNFALSHHWYATFLMVQGRPQEALAEIENARKLDPHSAAILADKGLILLSAYREKEAIALLKQLEDSDPAFLSSHAYLTVIYLNIRDDKEYLLEAKATANLLHDQDRLAVATAGEQGFASAGGSGMLRAMMRVQEQLHRQGKIDAYELASTYCLLGERRRALQLLKVSVEKREARAVALRIDHNLNALHDDPGFRDLLPQAGLPPLS